MLGVMFLGSALRNAFSRPQATMTALYLTIDTEYSSGHFAKAGKASRAENFARSIAGRTSEGEAGIFYQMDVLERHGLKAVFFVDPMAALVWGVEAVADVVGPIVARGHDVQLHVHSEWLAFAGPANPVPGRTGRDIKCFMLDEQCRLLDYARSTLIAAGAPAPVAFRAGNYGANDDTLRALASIGMQFDTSHCPGIAGSACDISLGRDDRDPVPHCGVIEVPVGCIAGPRGNLRHFQLTAISAFEIVAALRHAARQGQPALTLVSHSFELLSRDRRRINNVVKRRFERVCSALRAMPDVDTATYATRPPQTNAARPTYRPLPHNPLRTAWRYAEQALSNMR